jgi:hypothetical protein
MVEPVPKTEVLEQPRLKTKHSKTCPATNRVAEQAFFSNIG